MSDEPDSYDRFDSAAVASVASVADIRNRNGGGRSPQKSERKQGRGAAILCGQRNGEGGILWTAEGKSGLNVSLEWNNLPFNTIMRQLRLLHLLVSSLPIYG